MNFSLPVLTLPPSDVSFPYALSCLYCPSCLSIFHHLSILVFCLSPFIFSSPIPLICSSFFALPLLCSSLQCNTSAFPSHDLPFLTSPTLLFSSILMCLHFIFWFLLLSISLSEDLMAERCEGGTKCFLLSINTVLYACVALSPHWLHKGKEGRCPQRFIPCTSLLCEIFSHYFPRSRLLKPKE